jgi:predicted transposase YbfD/YdcC
VSTIVPSLATIFAAIPDPRRAQGRRHSLVALLLLACVAMLAGARGQSGIAEWAQNYGEPWRSRLGFTHPKGPSQSTLQRVFARINLATLEAQLACWAQHLFLALPAQPETTADRAAPAALDGVAMDGKTLRMSARCGARDAHLLSLCSHRLGVVLAQLAVSEKTNEAAASDDLLAMLLLNGVVITGDAMFTQQEIVQTICESGNDYLVVLKENQPTLLAETALLFADPDAVQERAEETDSHSQRLERRRLTAAPELAGVTGWPGLAQVLRMERRVIDLHTGEIRNETAYALTSLPPERATAQQLLRLWRQHWHIENKVHYVRDVTYGEDDSTVRTGSGPHVLAALRNTAITLLRRAGATNIAAACRRYAAQPALALTAVGLALENE